MTTKAAATKKTASKKKITASQIRQKANEIYQERTKKNIPGNADKDWIQAEKELNAG